MGGYLFLIPAFAAIVYGINLTLEVAGELDPSRMVETVAARNLVQCHGAVSKFTQDHPSFNGAIENGRAFGSGLPGTAGLAMPSWYTGPGCNGLVDRLNLPRAAYAWATGASAEDVAEMQEEPWLVGVKSGSQLVSPKSGVSVYPAPSQAPEGSVVYVISLP